MTNSWVKVANAVWAMEDRATRDEFLVLVSQHREIVEEYARLYSALHHARLNIIAGMDIIARVAG